MLFTCLSHSGLFYAFGNRNMVFSFLSSHETGKAKYVNTGRPTPYEQKRLHHLYYLFAQSHYNPAISLLSLAMLVLLLTRDVTTFVRLSVFLVPMLLWILVPVVFTPNPKTAENYVMRFLLGEQMDEDQLASSETRGEFLFENSDDATLCTPGKKDVSFTDFTALAEYEAFATSSFCLKLLKLVLHASSAAIFWLATPAIVKAQLIYSTLAWMLYAWITVFLFVAIYYENFSSIITTWRMVSLPLMYLVVLSSVGFFANLMPKWDEVTRQLWALLLQVCGPCVRVRTS